MTSFEANIPAISLKAFSKLLNILQKIGDDLYLEFRDKRIAVDGENKPADARRILLKVNLSFDSVVLLKLPSQLTLDLKPLSNIFKNRNNLETIEYCKIKLQENVEDRLIIQLVCKYDEVRRSLQTELTIDPQDFDVYDIKESVCLTFNLRELKAILALGDAMSSAVSCYFGAAGSPITFSVNQPDCFSTDMVLATLHDDPDSENIPEPQAKAVQRTPINETPRSIDVVPLNADRLSDPKPTLKQPAQSPHSPNVAYQPSPNISLPERARIQDDAPDSIYKSVVNQKMSNRRNDDCEEEELPPSPPMPKSNLRGMQLKKALDIAALDLNRDSSDKGSAFMGRSEADAIRSKQAFFSGATKRPIDHRGGHPPEILFARDDMDEDIGPTPPIRKAPRTLWTDQR
ncbi:hypothetical protein HK102_014150 [Quaeritorhiza haematococci]|nr:hypothetical protein HK102_014150 [Quaeritorhiza haematococci]